MPAPTQTERASRLFSRIWFWVFIFLTLAAYRNSFDAAFHYDDYPNIVNNPLVHSFDRIPELWRQWKRLFIPYFSFLLNWTLAGPDPSWFHWVNITIHLLNSVMVYVLTKEIFRLTGKFDRISNRIPQIATAAGLIFLLHPVQTQAVTYIVQRSTLLATLFTLASTVTYLRFLSKGKTQYLITSLFSFVLACFCKPIVYILPVILICLEPLRPAGKTNARPLVRILPYFIILAGVYWICFHPSVLQYGMDKTTRETTGISRSSYLITQADVIRTYLKLLVFPLRQNFDYDYPVSPYPPGIRTLSSGLFVSGLFIWTAAVYFKKKSAAAFGGIWFFLTLILESSVIPIRDIMNEHRLYLPLAGFSIFIAASFASFLKKPGLYLTVVFILAAGLSFFTFRRNEVWRTDVSLWSDVLAQSPGSLRALTNLGSAHKRESSVPEQIRFFETAAAGHPDFAVQSYLELAAIYHLRNDLENEIKTYEKILLISPRYKAAQKNLGMVYLRAEAWDQAALHLQKTLELDPSDTEVRKRLKELKSKHPPTAAAESSPDILGILLKDDLGKKLEAVFNPEGRRNEGGSPS